MALVIMAATAASAGVPILFAPAAVAQGKAFMVSLKTPEALKQAHVNFLGRTYRAWAAKGRMRALVAVAADDPVGPHALSFSGCNGAGATVAASCRVRVRKTAFGVQRLSLPEDMVTPDAATLERIRTQKERLAARLASASPERLWSGRFVRPLSGVLLSRFGVRRILNGEPHSRHSGVDLRAAKGEPVHAVAAGQVLLAAPFYFEGNLVVLDHGLGLTTIYCHLSEIKVKEGDHVKRGQVIGLAGATGRATGPHLHFGARLGEVRIDPLSLLNLAGGKK